MQKKKELAEAAQIFEEQFKGIFTSIDIDVFYDFYVDPYGWELIPLETKKLIMKSCAAYAEYKRVDLSMI